MSKNYDDFDLGTLVSALIDSLQHVKTKGEAHIICGNFIFEARIGLCKEIEKRDARIAFLEEKIESFELGYRGFP